MLGTIFRLSHEHASFGPYGRDVLWTVWDSVSARLGDELALTDPQARQHLAMIMGRPMGWSPAAYRSPRRRHRPTSSATA